MNAKSLIFWEIPRNTLIWQKSAEIGDIDVKYIYFPYNFGPKCWGQSVFGHNITLKISNILEDAQEYPNLAKISRSIFLISPVRNVEANHYLAITLPSKSQIFWEMPKNTLIWPKSAEMGVIDVKYIFFPYLTSPIC